MKKFVKLLAAVLIVSLALTGCGKKADNGGDKEMTADKEANENRVLVLRTGGDPASFNPDFKSDDFGWPIYQNLFNRLVKLGPENNIVLDLAESYEFNETSDVLTFHLHKDVKWHDGTPFTSADVKWTYETMAAEKWSKSDSVANVASIETPDENTVVMNLKTPDVSIISKLAWYGTFIMPKHLYEGTDTATNPVNQAPVGTGPYKFVKHEKGVAVTVERNDDFWGPKPNIKTVKWMINGDETTTYQAFRNGEIDYLDSIPVSEVFSLDEDPAYTIYPSLGINRTYVSYNFADVNFSKPEVRQAVALGIDRVGLFERQGGAGKMSETFISPVFTDFVDEQYKLPARDTAKAMELLEQAGYKKDANGFYFTTELTVFESGNFKDIAQIIQANLKEIGIDVKINLMEMGAWQTKVIMDKNYQMTMLAGYQGPDVSGVAGRVASNGGTNVAGYNNPELDAALAKGLTVSDTKERAKYYSEVQRIMLEDLPIIPLIDNGYRIPVRKTINGVPYQVADKAASSEMTYAEFMK